jgi:glycosyltransferase involved in cell wall biosynthesis
VCGFTEKKYLLLGSKAAIGGAQRVQLDLAGWLHGQGLRVVAAFFYDAEGLIPQYREKYPFEINCLDAWGSGGGLLGRLLRLARGWLELVRWLRRERFDAVLTFTHDSNLLGLTAAWLVGVPRRFGSHHGRFVTLSPLKKRLHAWLINSRLANGLVAVSEETRRQAMEEGVRPERVRVIINGVPLAPVSQSAARAARAELLPGMDGFLILNAARLVPEKGHRVLLQAAARVLRDFPNALFAIAGDGPLRADLTELAAELGIPHQVKLLGSRTDIPELLAASDLFVLSSLTEGLPMALLEAMAAGRAVVSTDVGGIRAALDDGRCGLLVPPDDASWLADALLRLLRDQRLRKRLAGCASEKARTDFSLEQMGIRYLNLLSD